MSIDVLIPFLAIASAYLVGSIPFGLLIGFARGIDIRQHGSKNIGATNAGRVLGRKWGYVAFTLDTFKGLLPVVVAGWIFGAFGESPIETGIRSAAMNWWRIGVASAAIVGHIAPVWLKFKGGKGVATGFGAMLGLWPGVTWAAGAALVVWIVTVKITRYVSVASIAAAIVLPVTVVILAAAGFTEKGGSATGRVLAGAPFLAATVLIAALVIWRHRANLARLRAGTENRIGAHGAAAGAEQGPRIR